jgi:uncharacterized protein YndB with AHSA1/START domain
MADTLHKSPTSLSISRVFDAPRETVFKAWTDPAVFMQWWGPPGVTAPSYDIDLRVGGKYRIANKTPNGMLYATGTFREVRAPEKLVFTWAWEEDSGTGHESMVTLEFVAKDKKTELTLTHERLADTTSRDSHLEGWSGALDSLAAHLAK